MTPSSDPVERTPGSTGPGRPQDERFRKRDRIRKRSDYVRIQTTGRRFRSPRLTVVHLPSAVDHTRIGITVSRKVGHAPTRARVKRWLREAFRRNHERWPVAVDFVVIARPSASRSSYDELLSDLCRWADKVRAGPAEATP